MIFPELQFRNITLYTVLTQPATQTINLDIFSVYKYKLNYLQHPQRNISDKQFLYYIAGAYFMLYIVKYL